MKSTLNIFVLTTIFVVLSITSALPANNVGSSDKRNDSIYSPDNFHPILEGSSLAVASSDKRSLIAAEELHRHSRIATAGSDKPDLAFNARPLLTSTATAAPRNGFS